MELYISFVLDLDIIKMKEYLVKKNLLMSVAKMNEYSNVATFVHAQIHIA